jgi:hypothetical protein
MDLETYKQNTETQTRNKKFWEELMTPTFLQILAEAVQKSV